MNKLFLFIISIVFSISINASHVPGGNITYTCISSNEFEITLTLFEDCGTAFISSTPKSISVSNTCGVPFSNSLSLQNFVYQQEVSQLCDILLPQSECNGGVFPGVFKHVWKGIVTLPSGCDSWIFSYDGCCRNSSQNLTGSSNAYYFETVLNSNTSPCNNSPVISGSPIPYSCINQPVIYNFGVFEPDGDSLFYSLVDALESPGIPVPYQFGYSGSSPINGISINSSTGEITFTPTIQGNFVVVVLIEEFDSNGNLVGSVKQDFTFEIINCTTNFSPTPNPIGLLNLTGTATQTSLFDIQACEGDFLCFDLEFLDGNPQDSLIISSNISQLFTGATIIQNSYSSPASATFCFTVPPGIGAFTTINVEAYDNACPNRGITSAAVGLSVISSTTVGQDVTICEQDSISLLAFGGSNFTWSVLSGDPIVLGTNFSCINCSNPIANPLNTTTYKVESNLSGGCTNMDTITVSVAPDFNYTLTQSGNSTCLNSNIQFLAQPSIPDNYTFQWNPSINLDNSNINNPLFSSSVPGIFDYQLNIFNGQGCHKIDTLTVNVIPAYSPQITLSASDSISFCGDTVLMNLVLEGSAPALCGPSASTVCNSNDTILSIGTVNGSNTQFSYPAPFGHYYKNAKHQFLYRASELLTAGLTAGKITELAWEALSQNGATNIFYDYTIKMGCTNLNIINNWIPNLTTVFSPQNISPSIGINNFQLTTAYEWDGISNIVIEICFNNLNNGTYTYNWSTPYQLTPYLSALYYRSDVTQACSYSSSPTGIENKRPVTYFKSCSTIPDPGSFTYQWSSSSFISSSTIQNPYVLPNQNSTYSVVVTDTNGGCLDSASIDIISICDTCYSPNFTIDSLVCFGSNNASITGFPVGSNSPFWIFELKDFITNNSILIDSNVTSSFVVNGLSAGNYLLSSVDTLGCFADTVITISEGYIPSISSSNDTTICDGDTIQVEAFGGTTFNWLTSDSVSNISISSPLVWPTSTTLYSVIVSDANSCEDTTEVLITVNPKPVVDAGIDQDICFGDSTSLVASGSSVSYSWNNGIFDGILFEANTTQDYIVVGTDINNCTNQDTVTVNILSLPTIDAGLDETICFGDSIQLSASGGDNYLWTPNNNITSNNISNPIVFPASLTQYVVTGTDLNNCSNKDSVLVLVNDLPVIVTSNDASICYGDSIIISASGGTTYQWLNQDSISNINVSNPEVWPSLSSTYQVIVTGANSCIDTAEINIQVNSLPLVNAGVNQNICTGDTTQINVVGAVNYQWSPNINISATNLSTISAWPVDTTSYIVTGIDANSCINKDTIDINVWNLPVADAGEDLWICPGGSLTLSASGGITYNWFPDSTLSSSVGTPTASPFDDETYVVEVVDINNCINYDTLFLKVEQNVPTDAGGDTINICGSTSVVLGGNPTSPIGSSYLWTSSSNITNPTNSNPTSVPSVPSWFTVQTTNDTCTGIDSVFVDFFSDVVGNSSIDTSICFGETTTISASGGSSYLWSPITNSIGDTILINESSANPVVSPKETTIFEVSIFDTNGCYIIDTTIVNIKQLPTLDLGADLSYCLNDSIELSSPVDQNYTYSWSPNYAISSTNIYNPSVYSLTDTNYVLALTDTLNCTNYDTIGVSIYSLPNVTATSLDSSICFGDSTELNASGSAVTSYDWSPSNTVSNDSIFNPLAFPSSSSYYFVTATDVNGCSNMDSLFITVLSLPIANAGGDTATCTGVSLQLNGSGGNVPEWINSTSLSDPNIYNPIASPNSATNYILKVTDLFGCINFDTILVDVFANVVADAGADIDTCANVPIPLQASGGVSYFWNDSINLNFNDIANPLAFPNDDIEFVVEVTDSNGCIGYDTLQISIFLAFTSNDTVICRRFFSTYYFGDIPSSISWSPTDGVSNPNIGNPILSPEETTTYLVDINNSEGCTITDTLLIEVPVVEATFDTLINPGCNGLEVKYTNTSNPEFNFYWIFSDNDTSVNYDVIKEFYFGSDFYGTLFVQDTNGCLDSRSYGDSALNFDDYFTISDPNIFTPNGDNMNDEFIIEIPKKVEKCAELTIYNRWGQIQYFSTGNNLKWDGKNRVGGLAPPGSYFYTLKIQEKNFSGVLNLMR